MLLVVEYWLDAAAAVLGVFATIVAIYTAFRLLENDRRKSLVLSAAHQPDVVPSAQRAQAFSVVRNQPTRWARSTDTSSLSTPQVSRPTGSKQSAPPSQPYLVVDRALQIGQQQLRLTLRNSGSLLTFEGFETGEFNEMELAYTPPVYREKESFAQGSALNFTMTSSQLDRATYHFFVIFSDQDGKRYRQEVAGMGMEAPIIENPSVHS